MIYIRELKAANTKRDTKYVFPRILGLLALILLFAIGLMLFITGIKEYFIVPGLLGLIITIVSIWVGYWLLKSLVGPTINAYKLFEENDVFVDPPALRKTDQLALDAFNGELKPTLRHIAQSPDFYYWERCAYISEWESYEQDYIRQLFGKDPRRVAQSHKTKELTQDKIEQEGFPLYGEECFELVEAFCSQKTQPSYLVDGDEAYRLYFGEYGSFECSSAIYQNTNIGDSFYIIRGPYSGTICMVYPTLEWHLHEDLLDLLQ